MNNKELNDRIDKLRRDAIELVRQFQKETCVTVDMCVKLTGSPQNGTSYYMAETKIIQSNLCHSTWESV